MNEEPKSIWKKSWTGWNWLWAWLIVAAATFLVFLAVSFFLPGGLRHLSDCFLASLFLSSISTIIAAIFVGLWCSIRWMFSPKNLRRSLFAVACLITLIALAYAEEDWRGWHAWNKFKHDWEAKGEKFDMVGVTPPPVPDDQNFALTPIWVESIKAVLGSENSRRWFRDKFPDNGRTNFTDRLELNMMRNEVWGRKDEPTNGNWAKGTITDLKPWQVYYRTPTEVKLSSRKSAMTNEFPIAPQPQSPAQDVLLALSKFDPVIEELRQASRLPYARFPLNYDSEFPGAILLPHLAALKRCSQVLQLRAIAELQNGQSEKALDDVKLSLHLADSIRTEPFLISHLVRIAILQITLQPVYEGLAEHKWSDAQLAELETDLAKLDFVVDYGLAMRGEMGLHGGNIDYLNHNRRELSNMGFESDGSPTLWFISSLIPTGWFYQTRLNCARMMVEFIIPLADVNQQTISPAAVQHADKALQAETQKATPYNILEKLLLPALGNAVKHFAYAQASVDLARVAIALERYRLAHGGYPESLDALEPQLIEMVPHDVITGQPLHYRHTEDGQFVLYSAGWNERDDGGVVVFSKGSKQAVDINQGDWVWRYPQK
jgi:hypothetical protein